MTTTRKVDRRERDIKKKLSAAVIMLLLSCIMVVTSTYAWFTLSTAPEITGISTTIGANGNLEIALGSTETWANSDLISSAEGDSLKDLVDRNITWGNLVDLDATYVSGTTEANSYGLDKIVLYPSKLNAANGKVESTSILKTPEYGTDGRVTTLKNNVLTALYNKTDGKFITSSDGYGVRALGTVSGMTDRELSYNLALSQINTNKNLAAQKVRTSWVNYGNTLATVAIKYAGTKDATTVTYSEYKELKGLVGDLNAVMDYIDDALIYALNGYLASAATTWDAAEGTDPDSLFLAVEKILLTKSLKTTENGGHVTLGTNSFTIDGIDRTIDNDQIVSLVKDFNTMVSSVKTATTKINGVESKFGESPANTATVGWADISDAFSCLVNYNYITVNDIKATEVSLNNVMTILRDPKVQLGAGDNGESSGVYYDISTFVDNYQSSVNIPAGTVIEYEGTKVPVDEDLPVLITTNFKGTPKLDVVAAAVTAAGKPSASGNTSASSALTDTYGYVLDFFLRTNAANSNLLLSEAANRVSTESEGVMGSGSNMSFTTIDPDFAGNNVVKLMEAIRVVFVDEQYNIVAEARLDKSTLAGSGTEYKMDLKIWDSENGAFAAEQVIINNMDVNTPIKLSTIVYLDGENVDNSMVANAAQSLSGSLNLQFASSEKLTPMNYTDFYIPDNNSTGGGTSGQNQSGSGDEGNN